MFGAGESPPNQPSALMGGYVAVATAAATATALSSVAVAVACAVAAATDVSSARRSKPGFAAPVYPRMYGHS